MCKPDLGASFNVNIAMATVSVNFCLQGLFNSDMKYLHI